MALTGAIADRIRGLIPITWDALKNDPRVGDAPLQSTINLAKSQVTGAVVAESQEPTYPLIVIDFIAKTAVIELCRAGVDYWMNQASNISARGTSESMSFIDRAKTLDDLRTDLVKETRDKALEIAKLIGYYVDNGRAVPQLSSATTNPFHLTPSPEEFPRPFQQTVYS